jgi:hypothetical protein
MIMAASSKMPSDLFAAKGRAMPACSKPLVSRQAQGTPAKPDRADEKPQDDGPASVLSIDLRRALVPARTVSPGTVPSEITEITAPARDQTTPSVAHRMASQPPPHGQGMAGPLIAAIVAISIAGGVFYVFERDRFGVTPVADEPAAANTANAPEASEENASSDDTTLSSEVGQAPERESAAPQEAPASESEAETAPDEGGSLPSFDLVRVEPDGSAVIAGRAAPYADLILLHNGEPIGKVKADWAGEWAFVTDKPLQADRHQITILVNDPDAKITLPEGAGAPAQVSGMGSSQPR